MGLNFLFVEIRFASIKLPYASPWKHYPSFAGSEREIEAGKKESDKNMDEMQHHLAGLLGRSDGGRDAQAITKKAQGGMTTPYVQDP